jgi:hypothetical protein
MKIKALLVIIFILISLNIYTLYKYNNSLKDASKNVNWMINKRYLNSLEYLNLYFNNPNDLRISLYATSSVYFETIGRKDFSILQKVDKNSSLCLNWTENTKKQYKDGYLDIAPFKDFNSTHEAMLKGLDITDSICRKKVK